MCVLGAHDRLEPCHKQNLKTIFFSKFEPCAIGPRGFIDYQKHVYNGDDVCAEGEVILHIVIVRKCY